jgi:hypothetical protein
MKKRVMQLLILAILVAVNPQLGAQTACETNGPEWCCENIYCPMAQGLCMLQGGEPMNCGWNAGTQLCEVEPCVH